MSYLLTLNIVNVRCHKSTSVSFKAGLNLLYGPNGSGKTSIMEALTLIAPTRSIRGASPLEIVSKNEFFFEVSFTESSDLVKIRYIKDSAKSSILLNSKSICKIKLIQRFNFLWLTQKIMLNFWQDSTSRRSYIDRICANFYPDHTIALIKYEKIRSLRKKLLEDSSYSWDVRNMYENMLAEFAYIIEENRFLIIEKINARLSSFRLLNQRVRISKEEYFNKVKASMSNIYFEGPHSSIFKFMKNDFDLSFGSTGEQNIALIYFTLEAMSLMESQTKILLLDDILNTIDQRNQKEIINNIKKCSNLNYVIVSSQEKLTDMHDINPISI